MTIWIKMFWVHDGTVTVCHSRRCHVVDCFIVEHQPQRKLGLQQLNTACDWRTSSWSVSDDLRRRLDGISDKRRRSAAR